MINTAGRIIGIDQLSAAQLYRDLIVKKADQILNDPTHPLHQKFKRSSRSSRFLQKKIRTTRFSKSFVPTAIRLLKER